MNRLITRAVYSLTHASRPSMVQWCREVINVIVVGRLFGHNAGLSLLGFVVTMRTLTDRQKPEALFNGIRSVSYCIWTIYGL